MIRSSQRTFRPILGGAAWQAEMLRLAATAPLETRSGSAGRLRVLIPLLVGRSDLFAVREGLVAHALQQRGADVALVLCDGAPACDARTFDHDDPSLCASCFGHGALALRNFGLPWLRLFDLLDAPTRERLAAHATAIPADQLLGVHHAGIALGPHLFSSTLRYLRAGRFEPSDADMMQVARRVLTGALLATEAAWRLLQTFQPDRLFLSHGIYASWGPWADLARALRIPFVSYGGGWRRGTLVCQRDAPRTMHAADLWPHWREIPLDATENAELDSYLATREDNRADFFRYFAVTSGDKAAFLARYDVDPGRYRQIVGLFTNVAFDAATLQRHRPFHDMYDWVEEVVDYASRHPEMLLLIKAHPAESRFIEPTPERWRIAPWLRRRCGLLPSNVRIIAPDDDVSTFLLYRMIDLGLVHSSSVGLEMALLGKPVLTTGSGVHYEQPGIVLVPTDRQDYAAKLAAQLSGRSTFQPDRELTRRYAYTLYFRKSIPFEPLDVDGWEPVGCAIDSLAELAPGNFPGLDLLCDAILSDRPVGLVPAGGSRQLEASQIGGDVLR